MTTHPAGAIESGLTENRLFPPVPARDLGFARWHVSSIEEYRAMHRQSIEEPEVFWAEAAKQIDWFRPWSKVLEWKCPDAKWFTGGTLNACWNCVDRHVKDGFGEQ